METPISSREDNSDIIISTGFSKKLDIPEAWSKIGTATEDTNVSPSSIHSSGSNRIAKLTSLTDNSVLLGVGRKFTGDENHTDDSDDHTDDENSPKQNLEDQLLDQLIEWPKGENRFFIPTDQQSQLVTPGSIIDELRRVEDREDQDSEEELIDAAKKIWSTAPKLFSILVCLGKGKYIYNFLEEGLNDEDLPFVRSLSQADTNRTGAARFNLSSRLSPQKPIKSMANWSRNDITGFGRDQWWMLAPVFKESANTPRKVRHYELDDMCVMPFIEDHERTKTIASGFSTVWPVRVHPAHQLLNMPNAKVGLRPFSHADTSPAHTRLES